MNISMDKKYTLDGDSFTLLTVTKPGDYPVAGYKPKGSVYCFPINGINGSAKLVEVSPYADFVIDEPVMVRDENYQEWGKRYFARINALGMAMTFSFGNTAWSNEDETLVNWNQCRRPTAEELAK